ncbi:metallophosphoesterase family protein [Paenibacillus sp. BAC0078]
MKLMIMGDLHYPGELVDADDRMNEARDTFFEQYLQEFLAAEADYHISVGDLTHAGTASEFKFIMQNVEQALPGSPGRFLYVLGNHDTHACSKTDIQNLTGQPRYMAIEEAEAVILLLDTARETPEDWSGAIDEEQLEWLRSQMTQYGDKPLLVFAHHPVYNTTARSTEPMMSLEPALDLLSILGKHQGPGIFFSGHNHVRSMIRRGRWSFVQTAAVPDAPEATVINLQGDDIRIETVQLCAVQYRELAGIFAKGMYDYDPRPYVEEDAIEEGRA